MLTRSVILLLVLASARSDRCQGDRCSGSGDPRPCTGEHCPSGRTSRIRRHAPAAPTCVGSDCATTPETDNQTRDCRGLECRLPPRLRPKGRARDAGDTPPAGAERLPPVHLADRAAQFLGDFPEFGQPPSEPGGAPLGVQLTCDVKPGENEVPSEDALILHLQLAKGQEKLVEALRAQQFLISELQQKLAEQQEALLSQQRDILTQQHRMYDQMDTVTARYSQLAEVLKQGELQSYFQSHLAGLQTLHNAEAKVMDVVGEARFLEPMAGCPSACRPGHYCDFRSDPPQCQKCTVCPPGFFLISSCSPTMDTMCQDRDECLELGNICGERVKCLNTPGGFRCLGVSQREAQTGLCGHNYFYNRELQECQACSDCEGQPVLVPCTTIVDSICGSPSGERLSSSWSASVSVPSSRKSGDDVFAGLRLNLRGKDSSDFLSGQDGQVTFLQHGMLWSDYNFAVKHTCRNFIQVGLRFNASQEEESRELSGVRVEQPDGKYFQGVSVSGAVEVEPGDAVSLLLRSPNQYCNQSKDLHVYDVAAPSFSLLWLSHDTGAVSMTAEMSPPTQYQSSYRPAFHVTSVSDPYVINLTHDNRGVRFKESGAIKFVLQQALYAMGRACVREGFFLVAYASRNGTGREVSRSFKTGVDYRDTSITLAGSVAVDAGDVLGFEITSPPQCNVRYFGDNTGISALSVVWIPSAVSSTLTATVEKAGLPLGAVRNKSLVFRQLSPDSRRLRLAGRNFEFLEEGTANVDLNLRLIHSCNIIKVTLQRAGGPSPVAQQVSGHVPEGGEWASVGLRASFRVQNGTAVYITLDCVRGRINQISREDSTNLSVLWVAASAS
ncbi:uncharacterized protein nell3 [Corythoichthys intestinalis]|uniref:uncharacterized protein nell3 n=1 Tax=Corythoichthys intestinalis TaxID=161448 RepID=UPI0025A60D0D|nr:uncharacterized protein nell3 [Corythoichthys intestinalis]